MESMGLNPNHQTQNNQAHNLVEQNFSQTLNSVRALYYDFFAGFFLFELLPKREELFLKQIDILSQSPIGSEDSARFAMLKSYLQQTDTQSLVREYSQTFNLPFATKNLPAFVGGRKGQRANVPNPQVFLYLSHYKNGCLNGEALLEVKRLVKQTHFRLNSKEFKESEDHFGFLLLLMRYLLQDSAESTDSSHTSEALSRQIFTECIKPMGAEIAEILSMREDLACYSLVGALLASFLQLEEYA